MPGLGESALADLTERNYPRDRLPDILRGWLVIGAVVVTIVGFVHGRPRLAGVEPREYWNEPFSK